MATETLEKPEVIKAPSEPLFSKKIKKTFTDPLVENNPITVQVLGICSSLAVTTQLKPSVVMAIAVIFVAGFANLIISVLRNKIPGKIRIIVELAVAASLVIMVDQILKAYMFDLSRKLGAFVGLIITNCIIMGRLEAFALGNKPWPSFIDGLGNGFSYGYIIIIVGFIRELFSAGTLWGASIIPQSFYDFGYMDNGLLLFPPGAFFILGLIIWVQRSKSGYVEH